MGREPRAVWEKRVERWRDSGLSAKEFGREAGVDPDRRRYWKWHLGKTSTGAPATNVVTVPFVEVTEPAACDAGAEPIEIVAPSGLRVRVPARFDEETLRRILRAVQ